MNKYSKEVVIALKKSELEMYNLGHSYVDIEHLILSILSFNNSMKNVLNKYDITYDGYKDELISLKGINNKKEKYIFYNARIKKIIDKSSATALDASSKEITLEHIFLNALEEIDSLGIKILLNQKININKIYKEINKLNKNDSNLLVYEIGTNLNELARNNKLDKVIGRNKEINQVIEILARKNKNNPILIGEAGVGKTAIIEALADKIEKNEVPEFLTGKTIVSLNIAGVISGTKYRGEFEEKLTKILKECEEIDDIIIFIDEVHTIVGAGGAEGAIDASNILKPILARGNLKIIGATTINEYKKYISSDKALDRRFQKIYINEPSKSETLCILKKIKFDYEKFHNVKIKDSVLEGIVNLANKYIFDRNEPDKSIDILDEACAKASIGGSKSLSPSAEEKLNKILLKKVKSIKDENYLEAEKLKEQEQKIKDKIKSKHDIKEVTLLTVKKVIESKCNSKIYDLENNINVYKYLEKELNKNIVGQKAAIKELINACRIFNNNHNAPVSIMFYGKTGVGKTMCAKKYAEFSNLNIVKLDMSEYSSEISVNKILGSPHGYVGYNDTNTSLESLKLNPNSLVILDEIDKAHPSVLNLFFNIFDDGYLKTSKDEKINFNNCIFIMTTNSLNNENSIGYVKDNSNNQFEIFSKEFLNRVNYFIKFKDLNTLDIKTIIKNEIKTSEKEYNRKVCISEEQVNKFVKDSEFETFGARKVKNIIKKYIEKNLIVFNTL